MTNALLAAALLASSLGAEPQTAPEKPAVAADVKQEEAPFPSLEGRSELALYPVVPQINATETVHVGTALTWSYHLADRFAVQLTPLFNYVNRPSEAVPRIESNDRQNRPPVHTTPLVEYGALAGGELSPLGGDFHVGELTRGRFDMLVNAGVGAASTRLQLRPVSPDGVPAEYASAGVRPVSSIGLGFRMGFGDRVAVRLEAHDLLFSSRLSTLNGCTFSDFDALDRGQEPASRSCTAGIFMDNADRPLARKFLEETRASLVHLVSLYGGVSVVF